MRKSCPMLQYGETWGHYAKWNKSVTKKTNVSYKWDHVVCTAAELLSKESCLGLGGGVRLNYSLEFRVYFARCKSSRSLLYNNVYIVYYTIHITMNTMVNFMLVFKIFFLMWIIFKVSIEFVATLLLLYVLVFWPWGMWDLSSPTRDRTCTPYIARKSLNHWTGREVPTS